MEVILDFVNNASPFAVLALALVIIYQLVNGKKVISKIRGTQTEKYPQITSMITSMQNLEAQNKTLLENHFKHEIPELLTSVKSINDKLDWIKDNHGNRLTRIETVLKID